MKKRFIVGLLLFVYFATTQTAQNPADFTGSLLWKVSGKELSKPSYIFGTYHLMSSELMNEISGLKEAFEMTDQIIGELNLEDMIALQTKMMQAIRLSEEESYKNLLPEDEYLLLDGGLKNIFGAGLDQLGTIKPGFLSMQIYLIIYTQINPAFNPMTFEAIDAYLQRIARENNKPSIGLETIEDQINAAFYGDTQLNQMKALICTVENLEYGIKYLKTMTSDYLSGNLFKIYNDVFEYENNPCREFSLSSMNRLNKNRNDKWIEQLPAMMREKPSLIVVGALHLAGDVGILYLLSKMGYAVEAVK